MSPDRQEVRAFQLALDKTPVDKIAHFLEANIIQRQWKRDLAEATIARRRSEQSQHSPAQQKRHPATHNRGWGVALIVISLIIWLCLLAAMWLMSR